MSFNVDEYYDKLKNGDVVDVEIEGLGKLSNPVKV